MSGRAPDPPARFTASLVPDGPVFLAGEIDTACLDALRIALDQAMLKGRSVITLDFTGVTFIGIEAISLLLRCQLVAASRHKRFRIENVSGLAALTLDLLDLGHIFGEVSGFEDRNGADTASASFTT